MQINKLNKRFSKLVQIHEKLKEILEEKYKIFDLIKRLIKAIS